MRLIEFGAVLSVGLVLGYFLPKQLTGRRRVSAHKNAFVLLVKLQFKTPQDKQAFRALFAPFAAWVAANEPGTVGYDMLESDKDETTVLLTERYATKAAVSTSWPFSHLLSCHAVT
jgi:quinol monooxygenase YgiN